MSASAARKGEAHLWLLLEEALVAVGRGGADPWESQRHFRYVADAVATAGVVPAAITQGLKHELDDALVVRRLIPAASFLGAAHDLDDDAEVRQHHGPTDGAHVWFEAEVERHLDLLASYDPALRPDAGAEMLRILAAPARAFDASGVFGTGGRAMLADLAASVAAAGFDAGRATPGDGRVRRDWVRFLRDRPAPIPEPFEPAASVSPRVVLGAIDTRSVRIDGVAWTDQALELTVALRGTAGFSLDVQQATPWQARVMDDRGRLHLGQPTRPSKRGGTSAVFQLRPGLEAGGASLQVRISDGARKVEGQVPL